MMLWCGGYYKLVWQQVIISIQVAPISPGRLQVAVHKAHGEGVSPPWGREYLYSSVYTCGDVPWWHELPAQYL